MWSSLADRCTVSHLYHSHYCSCKANGAVALQRVESCRTGYNATFGMPGHSGYNVDKLFRPNWKKSHRSHKECTRHQAIPTNPKDCITNSKVVP